jgi:hypothetical protein
MTTVNTLRRRVLAGALALAAASRVAGQPAVIERHGALDAFAAEGVALAWAILRGKDEAATQVIVRVEADPARYRSLAVTGVDPFSQRTVALQPARPLASPIRFAAPRAAFADHPRSEWRLEAARPGAPSLLVFYQGIPDTAPEFDDAAKLDAYLVQRVQAARRQEKP